MCSLTLVENWRKNICTSRFYNHSARLEKKIQIVPILNVAYNERQIGSGRVEEYLQLELVSTVL